LYIQYEIKPSLIWKKVYEGRKDRFITMTKYVLKNVVNVEKVGFVPASVHSQEMGWS